MRKILFLVGLSLVLLLSLFWHDYTAFHDGKLHVVFCGVGQGDAILIKTPNDKVVLVDGGPDKKVVNCLANHLPFWQRNIDLMLLSHPHLDHFFGMYYLLDRYSVTAFATEDLMNDTDSFKGLLEKLSANQIPQRTIIANDVFRIGKVVLKVESPTTDYIHETSPNGHIGEHAEFASLILRLEYGKFSALFTGDSQENGLLHAKNESVDVLQVPHHGSATGIGQKAIVAFMPKLAVISVGQKNRYGHPSKKVLDLLSRYNIPVERTDRGGDREIVSDGDIFSVSTKSDN